MAVIATDEIYQKAIQAENAFMTKDEIKASPVGLRFNSGKPRWSLVHYKSLEPMIRVLEYGAEKYDDFNWAKGLVPREILECMQRHLAALMDGEELDKESQLYHIGHVMCNAMFYSYFTTTEEGKLKAR